MKLRQSFRQSQTALVIALTGLLGIESCNHAGYRQREASALDCAKTPASKSLAETSSTDAGPPPCGLPVETRAPGVAKVAHGDTRSGARAGTRGRCHRRALARHAVLFPLPLPALRNQGNWIAEQRARRQILAPSHLEISRTEIQPEEWAFFRDALSPIAQGFPLLLTTGNHDYGNDVPLTTATACFQTISMRTGPVERSAARSHDAWTHRKRVLFIERGAISSGSAHA